MFLKDILISKKENKKIAIKCSEVTITYSQLYSESERVCNLLKKECVITDNIGIFLPNSIQYAMAFFSITFLDKVIVPIGIQSKKAEIKSIVEYCELGIIITNSMYENVLREFLIDFNYKIFIFNIDNNNVSKIGHGSFFHPSIKESGQPINQNSTSIMLHTSGTTSNPKRVMLTHDNLISNINSNIKSLNITETDKVLIALPMYFGYCNTSQFLTFLYLGASIVIMDSMFMPNVFLGLVQNEKITDFTGVPSMLLMLLKFKYKSKYDISSLNRICFGGGNMPLEKLKLLIKTFPTVGFIQTYGQTEASPRITALLPQDSLRKIGSVGKPIPNVQVRIVNENGIDVSKYETGEIIACGDNIMKGYYRRDTETSNVIKNGWLYTGDLAKFDDDGFIYLVGRKKNIIISGGINIYPEEVEELLMCHPLVDTAYVFGINHDILGEVPVAKVILNRNMKSSIENELKNYCINNLAIYKVPFRIEIVEQIEKTNTGKTKRY